MNKESNITKKSRKTDSHVITVIVANRTLCFINPLIYLFWCLVGGTSLKITPQMLCAGRRDSNVGGCHGDSGGPYVCQESDKRWVLQGAVSWGSPTCSAYERYTVFVRIAKFRNWIDTVMNWITRNYDISLSVIIFSNNSQELKKCELMPAFFSLSSNRLFFLI